MTWTEAQVREMYAFYERGESLDTIGRRYETSYETVRTLFRDHGLERRSPAVRAARIRAEQEARAERERDRIIDLYKAHGTINAVLERLDPPLTRELVRTIVDTIPNRESYRRRGVYRGLSREQIILDIQRAAAEAGEPLSGMAYQRVAPQLGLAAYMTVIKYFRREDSEQPWHAALKAAGVKANPPRGRRANATTAEQCVEAVAKCIRAHGGNRVSYPVYDHWSGRTISGASIRKIVGWNAAVEEALDMVAQGRL